MDNPLFGFAILGLCIVIFILFLLGYGEIVGGEWQQISQAVAKAILLIAVFTFACFVVVSLAKRR